MPLAWCWEGSMKCWNWARRPA